MCQCPISGKPHFYQKHMDSSDYNISVSMPYLGQTSFLPYPSASPVFMRVSRPIFAGNFQNILTNSQNNGQKWAEAKLYLSRYNFRGVLQGLLYLKCNEIQPVIYRQVTGELPAELLASQGHFRHDLSAPMKTLPPPCDIDILTGGNIFHGT